MGAKPETALQTRVKKALLAEWPGSVVWKIHGGPMQAAGIPDLVGCVRGVFIGLEVKLPDASSQPTRLQTATLDAIRRAGGVAAVVRSPQEACEVVAEMLAAKASLLEAS
jgi:hypothetical protein